jgi:hypothetical protein
MAGQLFGLLLSGKKRQAEKGRTKARPLNLDR